MAGSADGHLLLRLPASFNLQVGLTHHFYSVVNHIALLFVSGVKQAVAAPGAGSGYPSSKQQQTSK